VLAEVEEVLLGVAGFGAVCATEIWIAADTRIEQKKKYLIEYSNSCLNLYEVYQAVPPARAGQRVN
jgi:hypothetical protein